MTPLFVAMLATAMLGSPQRAPEQLPAATPGTGVIRGHISTADGHPLPRAQVTLLPSGGSVRLLQTDEDGSYQFTDLPAGHYMVTANHSGFVSLAFGQQRAFEAGQMFTLGSGEIREHVDIALPRLGAIVGHIADENGDPVEGVSVSVLKIAFTGGRRQLVAGGASSQRTNDQGRFRVYGVQPGRYLVSAEVGHVGSEDLPGYAATYFPGTPSPTEAQMVAVGLSENVPNVDFTLVPVRTARVSGRTVGADGQPFQGGIEMRVSRRSSAAASESFGARTERDGTFEFQNVPPGEYVLVGFKNTELGWQFVTVNGTDVTGLVVQTTEGSTISGRVNFEGASPPERSNVNITFVAADPDLVPFKGYGPQTETRSDGTFEVRFANGLGRLRPVNVPSGWALKSVLANGVDVTDTPLQFGTKEQSLKDVEVVLTNQLTQVAGSVGAASSPPAASYAVLIFSTDHDRWYDRSRFFAIVRSSRAGGFVWGGLPAGDYFIAAVDWLQPDELAGGWQDPALLEVAARGATRVTLTEGQKTSVSLKPIPR